MKSDGLGQNGFDFMAKELKLNAVNRNLLKKATITSSDLADIGEEVEVN